MAGFVMLGLAGLLIWLSIKYWQISIPIVSVLTIAYLIYRQHAKEKREAERAEAEQRYRLAQIERERQQELQRAQGELQRAQEAERRKIEDEKKRQAAHATEQAQLRGQLVGLRSKAGGTATQMEHAAREAANRLTKALEDYTDNQYTPFWDSIDATVQQLARYDAGIHEIAQSTSDYVAVERALDDPPAKSSWLLPTIPDVADTIGRLHALVRRAHADKGFAMTFPGWRINKTLIKGFQNVGDALNQIGERVESSLRDMTDTVTSAVMNMDDNLGSQTRDLQHSAEQLREQSLRESKARRKHEFDVEQMLDNIQRHQRPYGRYQG